MIISPPFLPATGLTSSDPSEPDPMMKAVDGFELKHHGVYPIAADRRWHCGIHLVPSMRWEPVRAIADGEVVAYRVNRKAISDGLTDAYGKPVLNCNNGFVLLKHTTETGDGRAMTFYSLYMHLLDISTLASENPQASAPETSSPTALAQWLATDTGGVQSRAGKKVYRKDILGYMGANHGFRHLHFEIFMTEADFDGWFKTSQLDNAKPSQPVGADYWGHTYYVIPGGTTLMSTPHRHSGSKYFPALTAGELGASETLYVEVWFHKGQRYMRAWLDQTGDGKLTSLTDTPISDPYNDYEYKLYERAMALYKECPSDGYELLRFGRILSDEPRLPEASRATYVAVPFDADGSLGYVDVNQAAIVKLSDADFPPFMGWKKMDAENAYTPVDQAGLWSPHKLRQLLLDDTPADAGEMTKVSLDQDMASYLQGAGTVLPRLRGFICRSASEWDSSTNTRRYQDLNDADGYFGSRAEDEPDGYKNFLAFLKNFQFMDEAALGGGKAFWHFHPLAFIRHFRKCGWLSTNELASTFPRYPFYTTSGSPKKVIDTDSNIYRVTMEIARQRVNRHATSLNNCLRKYVGGSPQRTALFLAQVLLETAQWRNPGGTKRLMHEWGFGKYSSANPATKYYGPFYGRGIMQLTWAGNYESYGAYRGIANNRSGTYVERLFGVSPRITATSHHYTFNPSDGGKLILWFPKFDPDEIAENPEYACDSGGFYWVSKAFSEGKNINRVCDRSYSASNVGFISRLVNGGGNGYYERQAYSVYMLQVLGDEIDAEESIVIYPPPPKSSIIACMKRAM